MLRLGVAVVLFDVPEATAVDAYVAVLVKSRTCVGLVPVCTMFNAPAYVPAVVGVNFTVTWK